MFEKNSKTPIMLLEDDTVDVITTKRAFKELNIDNPLIVCENGEEALEYLRAPDAVLPGLVLLDLNMPKMNGVEFLSEIRKDKQLKNLNTIVLTTSKQDQDRLQTFELNVAGYMLKPVDYQKFLKVIETIKAYWNVNLIPEKN